MHIHIFKTFITFITLLIPILPIYATPNDVNNSTQLSLDHKIGQMIMVGFRGTSLDDNHWVIQQISQGEVGGIILFDYDGESQQFGRNINSFDQLKQLCNKLQEHAPIPLLIAIDQEGGIVNRLSPKYGFPPTASALSLGLEDNPLKTFQQAEQIGNLLNELGINVNLAPVVDLNINPFSPAIGKKERSYSADPDIVVKHAREVILGHHKYHVATALKHFPGHGSATSDTHLGFVDVSETWSARELEPFRDLIASEKVDLVMTAHVFNKYLDPKYPATLSQSTINGILRTSLQYQGVIVTDDLQMKAISSLFDRKTAIKLAILAGADILLFANNESFDPSAAPGAIEIIKDLVNSGEISIFLIDASCKRIQKLKEFLK